FIYTTLQPRPEQLAETTQPDTLLYGRRSGSSTSAPQVAAAAALLKSTDPRLSPEGVRSILTATAVDLDTFSRRFVGSGRLDVAAALQVPFAGRVQLVSPDRDGGVSSDDVEVVGSVVSPLLQSYQVFVGLGDEESEQDDYEWTPLGEAGTAQVRDGVLAVWDTRGRPDSVHVLRLVATLTNGQEIEDRRRVYLDRTAPEPDVQRLDLALYQGQYAIQADVASDDFANVTLEVRQNGQVTQIATDRQARRHGARWVDQAGFGGMTEARLVLTNVAGLTTTTDWTVIDVPARANSPNRFDVTTLDVPAGYLMPETVDFDDDGLREIVFNRFEGGSPGDSLLFYEWAGDAFEPLALIEANLIPRDAGDTDGDGRPELLMQASAFTFMLEFDPSSGFSLMHDYTPESPERDTLISSVWGARLADLDGDGKGELIAHNLRDWYMLEFDGTRHSVVAQLDNPTDPLEAVDSQLGGTDPNRPAAQLRTLVGDFDDDGRQDLIVTDIDGDVIVYEAKGDDTYEAVWSATSGLYGNSESRLGMGDFDGDGRLEFVSYATTFRSKRLDNEYEPAYGVMSHWRNTGDDQFERVSELVLSNIVANQGTLAAIDTDGDGADELIVSHAPDLYVLRWTPAGWVIDYHDGYTTPAGRPNDVSAPVSINVAVTDFDRSGRAEFIASNADGQMRRYVPAEGAVLPVAGWAEAFALDAETVHLTWRAPDADSVVVWRAEPGTDFDPVASEQDSLIYATNTPARYRLQAWYAGEAAPLSEARFVRPHAPAVVTDVEYAPDAVRVTFSEPLDPATQPGQILIDGVAALDALLLGDAGRTLILGLDPMPVGAVSVNWTNLRDAEGTPVGQANIALDIPSFAQPTLVLVSWTALDARTAELTFSDALAPETAEDPSNYRVEPLGTVVSAQRLSDRPETVRLDVDGQALGATGLQTTIIVERMRSVAGTSLSPEGRVATLSGFAETLDDVYIFPNPFEAARHESRVVIAGLPREASIRIFSPAGVLVNTLDERDGDGGAPWDLRDTSGQAVPSGIYLVHIESGDLDPVIVKAVIVR
ncbi:MAG: FG-GAP-like repeat-containing protein, partial [Bacteroidota bacterium]